MELFASFDFMTVLTALGSIGLGLFLGMFFGSMPGLGIPGTVMAAPILIDGRAMASETSPGKALGYSLYASTLGGIVGGLVLILSIVGIYSSNTSFFDLWLALGIGIFAFLLRKLDYSVAGFVLAFVLAPIIETSYRRAMLLSNGEMMVFVERPISLAILCVMGAMLLYTVYKAFAGKRAANGNRPAAGGYS